MINHLFSAGNLVLDVEFGNSHRFFSASKNNFLPNYENSESSHVSAMIPAATLDITDTVKFETGQFTRDLSFLALERSYLFDAVSRFVVYSQSNRPAYIASKEIWHSNSNIYHQYPYAKPRLPIGDNEWITFGDNLSDLPSGFDNVFYIRDESHDEKGYRWIVHHRFIAKIDSAHLIVRGCHPKFNKPFKLQAIWPEWLKRKLYRIRESNYPFFPIQSVGEVSIPENKKFSIRTKIQVSNETQN